MKKRKTTILIILIFFAGLSLLLYPTFSNFWNSMHSTEMIASYQEAVDSLSEEQRGEMLRAAQAYNASLTEKSQTFHPSEEQQRAYRSLLDPDGNGVMGYLEIPSIRVELPIYHGTEESVLQTAAGHLEWSSLPVGGAGTHCVLSGHRGLPSARLFTDLDKLTFGDTFTLVVLDETLTYEVDQILTVEPKETEALEIQPGEDFCTLFTCTPYGINTHRLLVRGHRIDNPKEAVHITSEALPIEPLVVLPFVALPLLLAAFGVVRLLDNRRKHE